jgi:hypothetical protein
LIFNSLCHLIVLGPLLFLAIKHLWSSTLGVEDLETADACLDRLLEHLLLFIVLILWKSVRPVLKTGWTGFPTGSPDLLFLSCWSMGEVTKGSVCSSEVEYVGHTPRVPQGRRQTDS